MAIVIFHCQRPLTAGFLTVCLLAAAAVSVWLASASASPAAPNKQNLENWRQYNGRSYDFTLLDRNNGAGWDLAQKLLAKRNQYNRGRCSVEQALRHRYFLPELF